MADVEDFLQKPPKRVIETKRLRLRTLSISDVDGILPIISRKEVMQWTSQLPAVNIDQARRWLSDRALGVDVFNFAIELKSHSDSENNQPFKFIGVLGSYHWPAVGYLIHPEYAGKGYATEALQAWLRAYFEHVPTSREGGFDYVEASTDTQNWGSRKVLERCGFKLCEIHEKDFENLVFGLRDTAVYRIARPGTVLEDLGFIERGRVGSRLRSDGDAPVPPVQ